MATCFASDIITCNNFTYSTYRITNLPYQVLNLKLTIVKHNRNEKIALFNNLHNIYSNKTQFFNIISIHETETTVVE